MLTASTSCAPKLQGCPCTVGMIATGVDWLGVTATVEHCIHLLQTEGPAALHLVRCILAGVQALSGRNFIGLIQAFNAATPDVNEIITAIKAEFGL